MQLLIVASDHRGFEHKRILVDFFATERKDITCIDMGTATSERTDYPVYAHKAMHYMHEHKDAQAILLCGSGAGMAIVANRIPHIYAAVAWNSTVARMVKEDDNCNVLVIPSDFVADDQLIPIVMAWHQATFKDGVYAQRLALIDEK